MKNIFSKSKAAIFLPIVAGVLFVVAGLVIALPMLSSINQANEIWLTGKAGVGTRVEMHGGDLRVNNEDVYYLTFTYADEDGIVRQGKTLMTYNEVDAANAVIKGEIEIRYIADKAIDADFDKADAQKAPKLILLVFCGIGALLILLGVFAPLRKGSGEKSVFMQKPARSVAVEQGGDATAEDVSSKAE